MNYIEALSILRDGHYPWIYAAGSDHERELCHACGTAWPCQIETATEILQEAIEEPGQLHRPVKS